MVGKYCSSKVEEWQMEVMCRFYVFEPSKLERSIPNAKDRPVGGFHIRTPKDKLYGHLSRASLNCPGTQGLRKDRIHFLGCQLSLYCDALWIKKCRGHVPADDDEDVPR